MSWESKTDYCGLAVANKLICKSSTENRSGQYLERTGQHGAICATRAYGTENASPSNEYAVAADVSFAAGAITLGAVKEVDGRKYMLQSVSVKTSSAGEPTVSATAVQVEDGATTGNCFRVPAFVLSADDVAQILLGAFTLAGEGCELTECGAEISCTVGLHTVNGDPVASDPHTAHVQVSVSVLQAGAAEPTLTAADGWDVSSPLTCGDPDADLPTWTATLSRPLEKTRAASGS